MAESSAIPEHSRPLSDDLHGQTWPLIGALEFLNELAQQVSGLHATGSTHRAIHATSVLLEGQRPRLAAPEAIRRFGGDWSDPELCPPELADMPELELPASIAAASELLAAHNRPLDPRQIDLYQLGTLMCRLLTGGSVLAYMYSPAVKAGLTAETRALLERLLGFDPDRRFRDCAELVDWLDARLRAALDPNDVGGQADRVAALGNLAEMPTKADEPRLDIDHRPRERAKADLPFEHLGAYRILARLGQGGMGDVYKAYDESLGRTVALKVLPPALARHDDFVRRFRAEANAIARLIHPNVVQVFATGEDQGHHYFVMQFVDGESLAERLSRRRCLGIDDALRICEQCLVGLAAAHDAGLVHRDIKPANVLLDGRTGQALLADFGLVKTPGASTEITATGVILGTVDYISPEQARGQPVDGRSDLYSLGVMLFEMLSGILPFEADNPTAMVFQHAYEPPRVLSEVDPGVPHSLEAIIHRLLNKDPDQRYASARAVLDDLEAFREGRHPAAELEDAPLDSLLADHVAALASQGRWQWLRDRLGGLFYRYAPEALRELQSTSQQVDGAVAEYARRRQHFESLLEEARDAAAELEARLGPEHSAPAADLATLRSQIERQRQQVAEIESQSSKADATLARLRSQRDLLHARLKTAQARVRLAGERPRTLRERLHRLAMIAAWGVLLIMVAVAVNLSLPMLGWKPAIGVAPMASMNTTQPAPSSPPAESAESSVGIIYTQSIPRSIAFHPELIAGNTHHFVVGNSDGTVLEYSIGSNAVVRESGRQFIGHLKPVNMVAYSPDGLRLASASDDHSIRIWDVSERREIRRMEGHSDSVTTIQFSPDGGRIMSGSRDGTVRIWDVQTETEVQSLGMGEYRGAVSALAWTPDGGSLLVGARVIGAPSLALWNVSLNREERVFEKTGPIAYLRFTSDGRRAFYLGGGKLSMWDPAAEAQKGFLGTDLRVAAVSDDGRRALTAHAEGGVELWDLDRGEVVRRFEGDWQHSPSVLALSPDLRRGVAADSAGTIRVLDLPTPPPPHGQLQIVETLSPVECVAISSDGFHGVLGTVNEIKAWELGQPVANLPQLTLGRLSAITFSPDVERVLFATGQANSQANYVGLRPYARTGRDWAIAGQRDLRQFKGHTDRITGVAFISNGRRVLSGGADGTLRLWDVQSEQSLDTVDVGAPINSLAVSPDGRHVLLGLDDNNVRLWDWQEKKEVKQFRGHTFLVLAVGFSADGARAVSGSGDRSIRVWDVDTGECLATLTRHSDRVGAVAISADGTSVLSGSDDSTVRLWDVATAGTVRIYTGHRGSVRAVAIGPDGKRGLSGGEDGTARLWDLTVNEESN